jgi:hypothetical protein
MSVFLRWGIFGILGVAGLMYAYNASKQLAAKRSTGAAPAAVETPQGVQPGPEGRPAPAPQYAADEAVTPACEEELQVSMRAMKARRDGDPLDRLLRIESIAFQSDLNRRERLETVARKWFEWAGAEPSADSLRNMVLHDCWKFSPAP